MKKIFLFTLMSAVPGTVLKKLFMVLLLVIAMSDAHDALATQYFWVEPLPGQIPGGAKQIDAELTIDSSENLCAIGRDNMIWEYHPPYWQKSNIQPDGLEDFHLTTQHPTYWSHVVAQGKLFGRDNSGNLQEILLPFTIHKIGGDLGQYAIDIDGYVWVYKNSLWSQIPVPKGGELTNVVYRCITTGGFLVFNLLDCFWITPNSATGKNASIKCQIVPPETEKWTYYYFNLPEQFHWPYQIHAFYGVNNNPFDALWTLSVTNVEYGDIVAGFPWEWKEVALSQGWDDMAIIDPAYSVYLLATDGRVWHGLVRDDDVPCADALVGASMYATGDTTGRNSSGYSACGGYGPDFAHLWTAPRSGTYVFNTAGSNFDTVLYLKTVCNGAAVRCDDDSGGNLTSRLEYTVNKGDKLLIIVDGYGPSSQGNYKLGIALKGYECVDIDIDAMANETIGGSTAGTANRFTSSCGGNGPDVTYLWRAPASAKYVFDTQGSQFDTVLSLRSACGGPVLKCDDDSGGNTTSKFEYTATKNKLYLLTVDGYYATSKGGYNLRIRKK